MPDQAEACQKVCVQCKREGVADVKAELCESCIRWVEDRKVRLMFRTVEQMGRWQR